MSRSSPARRCCSASRAPGKGTQASAAGRAATAIPHHLDRRHLPRRGRATGRRSGSKAKQFMDRGELVPDDIVIGVRRASTSTTTGARRGRASSSTASRARRSRPRSSTRARRATAARRRRRTSTCPTEIVLKRHRRPPGVRAVRHQLPRRQRRRRSRWMLRHVRRRRRAARRRHRGHGRAPPRALRARRPCRSSDFYRTHGRLRETSTARATATTSFDRRWIDAIDRR